MNYRSVSDLNKNILGWIPLLPTDIDLIVGVPRSGLLAANLLSVYMNKPLADFGNFLKGEILGSGLRMPLNNKLEYLNKQRNVLIVDDSLNSGTQLSLIKSAASNTQTKHKILYSVVYIKPGSEHLVDYYVEKLEAPRIFEWNYMHHPGVLEWCFDIDGVLCRDPEDYENDDGENYIMFLRNVKPKIRTSKKLGVLVTCRLEKYREITEEWLAKNKISYKKLVMLDLPNKKERQRLAIHAEFKSSVYKHERAKLFVESSYEQAVNIANISGKEVLCVDKSCMVRPGAFNVIKRNKLSIFKCIKLPLSLLKKYTNR